eukprot:5225725-Pleurochrysis_carterae.AAC.1
MFLEPDGYTMPNVQGRLLRERRVGGGAFTRQQRSLCPREWPIRPAQRTQYRAGSCTPWPP